MGNVVHFRAADMKVGQLLPVLIMEQAVIWRKEEKTRAIMISYANLYDE